MNFRFEGLQQLGRALMLPIALLPVAGLLLRIGQPDLLNLKYIADAGNAVFINLPILFALGIAVGLAKDNNGTAALAAAVGYFIMTTIFSSINKDINSGVLGGILIGWVAAYFYNKYKSIILPDYLAFFGGKRFVPIITGISAVIIGITFGYIWMPIQDGLNILSTWLLKSGPAGLFAYGVLNRILLFTGLHHVLNNLVWFVFGDFKNVTGVVVHGDIARFMSGDKTAGFFMAGYFPIMMFGLPAACLAMYRNARLENKKAVAGLLLSMALTSFLTGVTEPIEFSFIFLAPVLFVIHAILTGLSMALMSILNVHLGFTFSAGLIDYVLFYKQAVNPIYLIPIGIAFFIIYYSIFSYAIRRFDLATPGRDLKHNELGMVSIVEPDCRALQFIEGLGGGDNLIAINACTTRLRLTVKDSTNINREKLKFLGAKGILAPDKNSLQVILGPMAEIIAGEIKEALELNNLAPKGNDSTQDVNLNNQDNKIAVSVDKNNQIAENLINVLGGKDNITSSSVVALTRIRFDIKDNNKLSLDQLPSNFRVIDVNNQTKQIYVGHEAEEIYITLTKLL